MEGCSEVIPESLPAEDAEVLIRLADNSTFQVSGGNSSVSMVQWGDTKLAVKRFGERPDVEDRIRREWSALRFFAEVDPTLAPKPFGININFRLVAQSWVDGYESPNSGRASLMLNCLERLKRASEHRLAHTLPGAADAINCPRDLKIQISHRCTSLAQEPYVKNDSYELLALVSLSDSSIDENVFQRTVSPSDFGPHNMLHAPDGIRLVDFEFFGLDDPHKLVAETLIHPMISWDGDEGDFVSGAIDLYALDQDRLARIATLARAKWATIILSRAVREAARANWRKADSSLKLARKYIEEFRSEP